MYLDNLFLGCDGDAFHVLVECHTPFSDTQHKLSTADNQNSFLVHEFFFTFCALEMRLWDFERTPNTKKSGTYWFIIMATFSDLIYYILFSCDHIQFHSLTHPSEVWKTSWHIKMICRCIILVIINPELRKTTTVVSRVNSEIHHVWQYTWFFIDWR